MANKKKKKSTATSKKRRGHNSALSPVVFMAGLILTVVTVAALFLARGPEPVKTSSMEFLLEDLEVEVESALLRSGYTLDQIDVRREPGLLTYEVRGYMPSEVVLDRLELRLQKQFADIADDRRSEAGEVLIYRGGALACLLQFERPEVPIEPPPVIAGKPQVVIIMDDLGRSLDRAREVVNLGMPVTFAILPGEVYATDVALLAARSGYEIMIHLPMEPHSYPATNPGDDALLLGQSEKEIVGRVKSYFKKVPYATGANNHMGSRFTEFEAGMRAVLEVMHDKGMFFIDSRTTGQSVVKSVANKVGVPSAVRDVFLDNVAEVDAINLQIKKLVQLAEKRGRAIGICHPYPETVEALRQQSKYLRDGPIEVVFASKMVSS
jgi:polysaccharide deacetylase 2 family uncharacterized protein YibQ